MTRKIAIEATEEEILSEAEEIVERKTELKAYLPNLWESPTFIFNLLFIE